jgi:hypothetical protein
MGLLTREESPMPEPPEQKTKPREVWTPDEIHRHRQTGQEPLSDEMRDYLKGMYEEYGVTPPADVVPPEGKSIEDFTPEDHFQRIRGEGR